MGDLVVFVLIVIVATLVFEAAWRILVALIVFGPAAYAAIVAGWVASTCGASVPLGLVIAIAFGALVRVVWFEVIAVVVSAFARAGAH